MFSHTQFLLIKQKKIFECFILFLESLLFMAKISKISKKKKKKKKHYVALFWQLGHGSSQSRACLEGFHDSLAGQSPSYEKYLENFSKSGF